MTALEAPRKGPERASTERPRRWGLTSVPIPSRRMGSVPFVLVLAGWGLATGNWVSLAVLAVSLFAVVAYSWAGLRFKERPFLDAATSATHFVSPAVYGLALAGATPTPALAALLGAFFLWGMASQMFGAVQDVVPDREGGLGSVATVLGGAAASPSSGSAPARKTPVPSCASCQDRPARPASRRQESRRRFRACARPAGAIRPRSGCRRCRYCPSSSAPRRPAGRAADRPWRGHGRRWPRPGHGPGSGGHRCVGHRGAALRHPDRPRPVRRG